MSSSLGHFPSDFSNTICRHRIDVHGLESELAALPCDSFPKAFEQCGAKTGFIVSHRSIPLRSSYSRRIRAVAFSRTGDPNTGEFQDAQIIGTFGEVDAGMVWE